MKPHQIEKESFRIILSELGEHSFTPQELPIVQRVIHATADFEFSEILQFSPQAIQSGISAIRNGCKLVSDVQMITAGVSRPNLEKFGCSLACRISHPEVIAQAKASQKTRSETAMQHFGPDLNNSIVLIGNAPTALFEVLRLHEERQITPALVIGVPVGFVNALESKDALMQTNLNFISAKGRKGGSTVAVSIMNALLRLAGEAA
jgi:precorrin-8X/cobalt-precorrin-8 methylmutase